MIGKEGKYTNKSHGLIYDRDESAVKRHDNASYLSS